MITKNGAPCLHTGQDGSPVRFDREPDNTFSPSKEGNWFRMQMLPAHPQRFEFIRKENIRTGLEQGEQHGS